MRLNLGAGGQTPDGWVNVDRAGDNVTVLDIVRDEWPWEPGTADGIVIHHVLDLFHPHEMQAVLERCWTALADGAVLRISCADLNLGVQRALERNLGWFAQPCSTLEETLGFFITQRGARKQHLTPELLDVACTRAGFHECAVVAMHETIGKPWLTDLDSRENESWFFEARK